MANPIFALARAAAVALALPPAADPGGLHEQPGTGQPESGADGDEDEFAVLGAAIAAAWPPPAAKAQTHKKWVARSRQAAAHRAARQAVSVASHIGRANDHAVRQEEVICMTGQQQQAPPPKGKGPHRRWTAAAMLRCAFGGRPVRHRHAKQDSGRKRKPRTRPSSAVAASVRAAAAAVQGAHAHVQRVRDAISCVLMHGQGNCSRLSRHL